MGEPDESVSQPLKLTYAAAASEARWVTIGQYTPFEAQLAQAKLQSEGIRCALGNENSANFNVPLMVDVELQVLADDAARAKAVLDSVRAVRATHDKLVATHCPKCFKNNVEAVRFSVAFKILSMLFLGLPLLLAYRFNRCNDCGHRWRVW